MQIKVSMVEDNWAFGEIVGEPRRPRAEEF